MKKLEKYGYKQDNKQISYRLWAKIPYRESPIAD